MASRFDSGCEHQNMGVVLMVARWIPNPKVRVQILAPMPSGYSIMVLLQISNLKTGVRFSLPAPL